MHGKAIWKPGISEITKASTGNAAREVYNIPYEHRAARGQSADARWVIAYSHKTQSFMKNGAQQKYLDKALSFYIMIFGQVCYSLCVPLLQSDYRILWSSIYLKRSDWYLNLGVAMCAFDPIGFEDSLVISISERNQLNMTFWNYENNVTPGQLFFPRRCTHQLRPQLRDCTSDWKCQLFLKDFSC